MPNWRNERVSTLIKEVIGSMVVLGEIKDPRVDSLAVVHRVEMTKDLSHAKVYVSGYLSDKKMMGTVEGLNHAAGFIQSQVAQRVQLRITPRLAFFYDSSIQQGQAMNRLIDTVANPPTEDDAVE